MARKKIIEEIVKISVPKRQARFYVSGGDFNPIGYKCSGIAIMRNKGESTEELRTRCRDSVSWPTTDTVHCFIPLQKK